MSWRRGLIHGGVFSPIIKKCRAKIGSSGKCESGMVETIKFERVRKAWFIRKTSRWRFSPGKNRRRIVCERYLAPDLMGYFRQHDITAFIHLPFIDLDRGDFSGDAGGWQIEHAIGGKLAAALNPKFIVGCRQNPPFLKVTVNVHVIAHGPQASDSPAGGQLLQREKEQGFRAQAMQTSGHGDDEIHVH
jgi:hypothetical protein